MAGSVVQHPFNNVSVAAATNVVAVANPVVGNTLLAWANANITCNLPSDNGTNTGWTLRTSVVDGNGCYLWTKAVAAGDAAMTTVTINHSSSNTSQCGVVEVAGVTGFDVANSGAAQSGGSFGSTASVSVTTTGSAGDFLVHFAMLHAASSGTNPATPSWTNGFALLDLLAQTIGPTGAEATIIGTLNQASAGAIATVGSWSPNWSDAQGLVVAFQAAPLGKVSAVGPTTAAAFRVGAGPRFMPTVSWQGFQLFPVSSPVTGRARVAVSAAATVTGRSNIFVPGVPKTATVTGKSFITNLAIVQHVEVGADTTASVTVAHPALGNLLIGWANADITMDTPTDNGANAGWTLGPSVVDGNAVYLWYRTATATDVSSLTSVTFNEHTTPFCLHAGFLEVAGAGAYDVSGSATVQASGGSTSPTLSAVTTTGPQGDLVVALSGIHDTSTSPVQTPTGWTNAFTNLVLSPYGRQTGTQTCSSMLGYLVQDAAGSITTQASWSPSYPDRQIVIIAFDLTGAPAHSATVAGRGRVSVVGLSSVVPGRSRVQVVGLSSVIPGQARLAAALAATVPGRARLAASVASSISGRARIQAVGLSVVQPGRARVSVVGLSVVQPGRSRVQVVGRTVTQPGRARLSVGVSAVQLGRSRVSVVGLSAAQPGRSRLSVIRSAAQTGVAHVVAPGVPTLTVTGRSRVQVAGLSAAQPGRARLQVVGRATTVAGQSRLSVGLSALVSGRSRVQVVGRSALVSGRSRVQVAGLIALVTGRSRLSVVETSVQGGRASIVVAGAKVATVAGRSRLSVSGLSAAQPGRARVSASFTLTVTGRSRLAVVLAAAQPGRARLSVVGRAAPQPGRGRVQAVGVATVAGRARLANTFALGVTGRARVSVVGLTSVVAGKANVVTAATRTATVSGRSRISATLTLGQSGRASIVVAGGRVATVGGKASVRNTVSSLVAGQARVARSFGAVLGGRARLAGVETAPVPGRARVRATPAALVGGQGRISRSFSAAVTGRSRLGLAAAVALVPGQARVRVVGLGAAQVGRARVVVGAAAAVGGQARVVVRYALTVTARGRVQTVVSATLTARTSVSGRRALSVTATARVIIGVLAHAIVRGQARVVLPAGFDLKAVGPPRTHWDVGEPESRWDVGEPITHWREGMPETRWQVGAPTTDWRAGGPS